MNNEDPKTPVPAPTPVVYEQPPTQEQIEKKRTRLDFDLGAGTQHLRLPDGLPKGK